MTHWRKHEAISEVARMGSGTEVAERRKGEAMEGGGQVAEWRGGSGSAWVEWTWQ